jgi:catechol 2,3-dioxygenase-like lactoylglutathione lyase family enzyme
MSASAKGPHYGYHHVGFTVDDLQHTYQELLAKGYVFSTPPTDAGKNKVAFFSGPDNIIIELMQPLA